MIQVYSTPADIRMNDIPARMGRTYWSVDRRDPILNMPEIEKYREVDQDAGCSMMRVGRSYDESWKPWNPEPAPFVFSLNISVALYPAFSLLFPEERFQTHSWVDGWASY